MLTLVVAVVGVAGTRASAVLTQHGATRAKRLELEYTEALMGIPDTVREHALDLAARLDVVHRLAKRFDTGATEPGDSLHDARAELKDVSGRFARMRHLMRTDLGIADAGLDA